MKGERPARLAGALAIAVSMPACLEPSPGYEDTEGTSGGSTAGASGSGSTASGTSAGSGGTAGTDAGEGDTTSMTAGGTGTGGVDASGSGTGTGGSDSGGTTGGIMEGVYLVRVSGTDPADCSGGQTPETAWNTIGKAASCVRPGDSVYVGAGEYRESVEFTTAGMPTQRIRLIGDRSGAFTTDAGLVTVDANGAPYALRLNGAGYMTIRGFDIARASSGTTPSGGIVLGNAEAPGVVIAANRIFGNPHGVYVRNSDDVVIESNRISNNSSSVGDGVVIRRSNFARVRNNLIYNHSRHGLIVTEGSEDAQIEQNTLYANSARQVRVDGASLNIEVVRNIITAGGDDGVEVQAGSTVALAYNVVFGNVNAYDGIMPGPTDIQQDPLLDDPAGPDGMLGGANGGDDSFFLQTAPQSPAIDAGPVDADMVPLAIGTFADLSTRLDGIHDGTSPDGAAINLGFHY